MPLASLTTIAPDGTAQWVSYRATMRWHREHHEASGVHGLIRFADSSQLFGRCNGREVIDDVACSRLMVAASLWPTSQSRTSLPASDGKTMAKPVPRRA